ncbi:MAG TPA: glycoside hydrolase family 20 zincin-like fold domain-containing protein [Vicinamibacteria bacterium]|nr:glycoside hydrolase family 20 zincin-like fold domain-containing protein [Vicinamibacteria bacterium]
MRHRLAVLAVGLLTASPAWLGADPQPASPSFPLWPIPREARVADTRLLLTEATIVVPSGDARAQSPGRLLAELLADHFGVAIPVAVGATPAGRTPIVVGEASAGVVAAAAARGAGTVPEAAEGYLLSVDASGAVVAGRDYRGALYGVSSFVQLVHRWGKQSVAARQAVVRDWPFLPIRWVHLYLPGRDQLDFARRTMRDVLLRYKFNGIVLEVGGGMRLESHPEISVGWKRTVAEWYAHGETMDKFGEGIPLGTANRFAASLHVGVGGGSYVEKDDVRRLAEWADLYGLEIIPEVQALSHTYSIASARRDLTEDPEMAWPDSYCPSNPESYRVYFDVLDEVLEVLRPRRVHIGHDEWRAGAFCPRCRGKDTGALYAADVLKIHQHLREKGIETWMWGDHFVDGHNRFGKSWSEGGVVRYERPDTTSARDIVAAATSDIRILNWSGEAGDATFQKLGWPFIVGNFAGSEEKDWRGRVSRHGALGGEVSSWGAWEEFVLGKLQVPEAVFSSNLLWSVHDPEHEDALAHVGRLLPEVRGMLAQKPLPSYGADPMRFEVLDIVSAFNHPPKGDGWDLTGLRPGRQYADGLPYAIADPARWGGLSAVRVARRPGDTPTRAALPIRGRWASLVFVQSASAEGRPTIHAGDQTHFPRESSELLGFYEIRYEDDLVATHEIRYDETVGRWDAGLTLPLYFARPLVAGTLPDGRPAVVWASEWANARPDVPIASVTLVGSPGPSKARPILFGVTAVEKPRVEDLR